MAAKKKSRKYGPSVGSTVERVMRERKEGSLRSGRSKKKVTSRKQAIAIALSEARASGKRVPRKKSAKKGTSKKRAPKTGMSRKRAPKKTAPTRKRATKKRAA